MFSNTYDINHTQKRMSTVSGYGLYDVLVTAYKKQALNSDYVQPGKLTLLKYILLCNSPLRTKSLRTLFTVDYPCGPCLP